MKATVYGQFVAGEDLFTIKPTIAKLRKSGVRSILDYAVEEDVKDARLATWLAMWLALLHWGITHIGHHG